MAEDILLKSDLDLDLTNGLVRGEASEALLIKLCFFNTGSLKFSPLTGAGVRGLANAKVDQAALRKVYKQLERDKWTNETVEFADNKIYVEADRAR